MITCGFNSSYVHYYFRHMSLIYVGTPDVKVYVKPHLTWEWVRNVLAITLSLLVNYSRGLTHRLHHLVNWTFDTYFLKSIDHSYPCKKIMVAKELVSF